MKPEPNRPPSRTASVLPRQGLLVGAMVALLALTLLGPAMTIYGGDANDAGGSAVRQIGYLAIFAAAIAAVRPIANPRALLAVPVALLVALGWCWLSVTWAIEPGASLRRVVLTSVILFSAFVLVRQLGYERTLLLVRSALVILLIANFLAVLLFPELGIHQSDEPYDKALIGDWRGVMAHKNLAGLTAALTVLLFLFDARRMPSWLRYGVIAAGALFLVLSGSRTSLGVCTAAILVGTVFSAYRARYRGLVLGLVVVAAIAGATYLNVYNDPLLRNLNDPTALTGRTQIWNALLRYSEDNYLLGAGYGSFWGIGDASPIYLYGRDWVQDVSQGHNGFLDLLVQIGMPGLLIVLFAAVLWPLIRLFRTRAAEGAPGALIVSVILFCVAHNATETSLFDRDSIGQVFLMLAIALLWTIGARTVAQNPLGRINAGGQRSRPPARRPRPSRATG